MEEGPENGYTSIPTSVYWAIVTTTTVGYGDVTPHTDLGKFIASAMMLLGWGILAVPTGIVSAEMTAQRMRRQPTTRTCHKCLSEGHDPEAKSCERQMASKRHKAGTMVGFALYPRRFDADWSKPTFGR